MGAYDLIVRRRTIRKFQQKEIGRALLEKMVDAARLAPSANNMQPLKYIIVDGKEKTDPFFKLVKWAGYIAPAGNPGEDEKPVAYIVILLDREVRETGFELDVGAAAQNIFLTALEEGVGSCWMGAVDRDGVRKLLNLPERYVVNTVVALGYPAESPVSEEENGSIRYYKDEDGVLHVPKRKLEDVLLKL
jgi:nitroreductase